MSPLAKEYCAEERQPKRDQNDEKKCDCFELLRLALELCSLVRDVDCLAQFRFIALFAKRRRFLEHASWDLTQKVLADIFVDRVVNWLNLLDDLTCSAPE